MGKLALYRFRKVEKYARAIGSCGKVITILTNPSLHNFIIDA